MVRLLNSGPFICTSCGALCRFGGPAAFLQPLPFLAELDCRVSLEEEAFAAEDSVLTRPSCASQYGLTSCSLLISSMGACSWLLTYLYRYV